MMTRMEPTDDFQRRAFRAAGPVFLVALGTVLLLVLAVMLLLAPLEAGVGWTFAFVGVLLLVAGLLWGSAQGKRRDAHRRGGA